MVKNLSAVQGPWVRSLVGEVGSHMPQSNKACWLQLLKLLPHNKRERERESVHRSKDAA